MGCSSSLINELDASERYHIRNPDRFTTFRDVQSALRRGGLETSQLIIGIDCTKSNTWNGFATFGNKSLHHISNTPNQYEYVMQAIGRTLLTFDDDGIIPLWGFGDVSTTDKSVFSFKRHYRDEGGEGDEEDCKGFDDVLDVYRSVIPKISLSGPTSFSPIIRRAVQNVISEGGYHILIIIADGEITNIEETSSSIVYASDYALSIVVVGVGDGPWETMERFDDNLPDRKFDNFQFVNYKEIMSNKKIENYDVVLAMNCLMECPDQYLYMKENGLIKYKSRTGAPGGI